MGVILDTSILVAAERRTIRFESLLEGLGDEQVAITAITAAELMHGCHRAADAATRARRWAFVDGLLDALPILPFSLIEARRHAQLWAEMAVAGRPIGPHDLIIAATAVANGHELATLNRREFNHVPGLRLVSLPA